MGWVKSWIGVGVLCVLMRSGEVYAADIQYKSTGLRDPFVDLTENEPKVDVSKDEKALSALSIQGIVFLGEKKSAIINNGIYNEGSRLLGGQVTLIERDGVTVSINGKTIRIPYIKKERIHEKKDASKIISPAK